MPCRANHSAREQGYIRVFDAIVSEETVLRDLYAPLMQRLSAAGGTLAKLSFTVSRVVDVDAWAAEGEKLFDKRVNHTTHMVGWHKVGQSHRRQCSLISCLTLDITDKKRYLR